MSQQPELLKTVCDHMRHAALLQSVADTLEWDERTGMPIKAGEYRATQVSTLRAMTHSHLTDPRFGEWLHLLSETTDQAEPHCDETSLVRELVRDWQRNCRIPVDLVERLSAATVRGQQVWDEARKSDDFSIFAPALEKIVSLKQELGMHLADGGDPYESLVAEYEPGAKVNDLVVVFESLREPLVALVAELRDAPRQPNVSILQREYPIEDQRKLSRFVAESIGFDFERGRLDETSHPFCTSLGPHDCRILTRYGSNWLSGGLFGTIHEAGHGIYEQGLRETWHGLPPGSYSSLGIHESQSRLWENQVGRSLPFWKWLYPKAKKIFGWRLEDVSVEDLHFALNSVMPSLIRVDADEATYNLHIIIRFELEKALIGGELQPAELPTAWNEAYQRYLGIQPPSAASGVLQDVHWSAGLFGYFPTYTLGNLAAAQFYAAAEAELGNLDEQLEKGQFQHLFGWLRRNIHCHGRNFTGAELVKNATGSEMAPEPLLKSLQTRYDRLYR